MKKHIALILLFLLFTPSLFAGDLSPGEKPSFGLSTDILPYISAAAAGNEGFSIQGWVSSGSYKYRVVAAKTEIPEIFLYEGTDSHELTVIAFITDYYFKEMNRGPWIGGGIELWKNRAGDEVTGEDVSWDSIIITLGGGYTFMLGKHLYLNPFAAMHFNPAPESVKTEKTSFREKYFLNSASVKIGWMF